MLKCIGPFFTAVALFDSNKRTNERTRECSVSLRHHENIFKFIYLWFRPDSRRCNAHTHTHLLLIFLSRSRSHFDTLAKCGYHATPILLVDARSTFFFFCLYFRTKARPKRKLIILFDTCTKMLSIILFFHVALDTRANCVQIFMSNLSDGAKFWNSWW